MDLPIENQIISVEPSTEKAYHFKDKQYSDDAPSHYYFCLPINNDNIALVMLTSQVDKLTDYYNRVNRKCLNSLVYLDRGCGINFIKKKTVVDCNKILYGTKEEIAARIDGDISIKKCNIGTDIIDSIILKIQYSPLVKPNIKKVFS